MSLTRINEFEAVAGKETALKEFLEDLLVYLRGSSGCKRAELLIADEDPSQLLVIEEWESKEHHATSLAAYPPNQMEAAMPLIGKPPRGRFFSAP